MRSRGETQSTTVKMVSTLMLTWTKKTVLGHFRKYQWVKFAANHLNFTN